LVEFERRLKQARVKKEEKAPVTAKSQIQVQKPRQTALEVEMKNYQKQQKAIIKHIEN
jgi:hypothetical protein